MGTTLTGLTPATTYDALIKVTDNGPIGATNKLLTDGLGNDSAFYLGTAGVAIKATSVLSFNGPSDTTHSVGYDSVIDGTQLRGQNGVRFSTGSGGGSERMRITSDGNVKLGASTTGTPSANADDLVIDKGAAESGITIMSTAAATLRFGDAANTSVGSIEYDHSGDYMRFNTSGSEKVRITSAGNVGIGTSTADIKLDVRGTAATVLRVSRSGGAGSTGGACILFEAREPVLGTGQTARIDSAQGYLLFNTGGVSGDINGGQERLRIDSTGNFLVATTVLTDVSSSGAGNEGAYIKTDGQIGLATSNDTVGIFNRKTSAGTLLDFRYNGTSVGSIGVAASSSTISLEGGGIYFDSGASKYLDDYEEGAFTPTTATSGYLISTSSGVYTKIGRQVTINCSFSFSAVNASSTSAVTIGGLPFTSGSFSSSGSCRESQISGAVYAVASLTGTTNVFVNSMDGVVTGSQRIFATGDKYVLTITYFV